MTAPYDSLDLWPIEEELKRVMNLPLYEFFEEIYPKVLKKRIKEIEKEKGAK